MTTIIAKHGKTLRHMLLSILAAVVTLASPAIAQTGTGSLVTSPTRIPGDADGVVKLDAWAKRVTPALPRKTTVYGPCAGLPDFTYRVRQTCPVPPVIVVPPVVVPPVVVPPVVVTPPATDPTPTGMISKKLADGGYAVQIGRLNLGFNAYGGLGTTVNVGEPYLTDADNGYLRVSYFLGTGNDLFLYGRSQDIMNLTVNGRTYSSGFLAGYNQLRGTLTALTFDAETFDTTKTPAVADGIKLLQQITVDGIMLDYRVRVTNTRPVAVTVRYFRSEDPDTKASYATKNKVLTGAWEAGLTTGQTYVLSSPDLGVYAATITYDKATEVGTRREVGYLSTSDVTLQLVWPDRVLQPGESTEFRFRQGVRE